MNRLIPLAGLIAWLVLPSLASAQSEQYMVSDFSAASVSVFDPNNSNSLTTLLHTGSGAAAVAVSPDGRFAYVANTNSNYLSIMDLTIRAEIRRVPLPFGSRSVAILPDGSRLVVPGFNGSLTVVNTSDFSTQSVSTTGQLCDDSLVCDSPQDVNSPTAVGVGTKFYINYRAANIAVRLSVLDVGGGTPVLSSIPGTVTGRAGSARSTIAATSNGQYVVAIRNGNIALVVNTTTNSLASTFTTTHCTTGAISISHNAASPVAYISGTDTGAGTTTCVEADSVGANGVLTFVNAGALPFIPPASGLGGFGSAISVNDSKLYVAVRGLISGSNFAIVDTAALTVSLSLRPVDDPNGLADALVQLTPPGTAPTISRVIPTLVVNNAAAAQRTIRVSGANFAADGLVRLGNLNPLAASQVGAQLQVTVPLGAAAQTADVIVTDPNGALPLSSKNQSGILRGQFLIANPPTFQPANQVVAGNADDTISVLNVSTNASIAPSIAGFPFTLGVAITPGGDRAYVSEFFPANVNVYNFETGAKEASIFLNSQNTGYNGIASAKSINGSGGAVVYVTSLNDPTATGQVLFAIGADPASPGTLNQVIQTISLSSASFDNPGALAVSRDGRYVYSDAYLFESPANSGTLIIYDTLGSGSVAAVLPMNNIQPNQERLEISPDGNYLLMEMSDGSIGVFNIGASPLNPSQSFTIAAPHAGQLFSYRIPRNMPNRLIALESPGNYLHVFNFDPSTSNFTHLGQAVVQTAFSPADLDVTPEGSLVYVTIPNDDAVAVLDASKVAASDPAAQLTKIRAGIAVAALAVRPGTPTPAGSNVQVQPIAQVSITFSGVTTPGETNVATTNTTPVSLPAGFQVGSIPVYFEITTTAAYTPPVTVCFTYNPALVPAPESALRVAHYDVSLNAWVDVTVPPVDTVNHRICAQVSSFSPFVIGIASPSFLLDTLGAVITKNISPMGIRNSLLAKVQAAKAAANRGNNNAAANQLIALGLEIAVLSHVNASVRAQAAYLEDLIVSASALLRTCGR